MEFLNVIVAALAAFGLGALWYMVFSKSWVAASGVATGPDGRPLNAGARPFVIGFIAILLVAGMMRHLLASTGLESVASGMQAGFGVGAFLITPWIALNAAYAGRPAALVAIDGGYATLACTVMGLVLTLF
jgi:hypothetical protein